MKALIEQVSKLMKFLTLWDKIMIGAIVVLSIVATLSIPILLADGNGEREAVVTLRGEDIYRFPIDPSAEEEIPFDFVVDGETYTGVLEMRDGAVRLQRLPREILPLPIHHDMGWIRHSYEVIVALPIQMTVTIEAAEPDERDDGVDFIVQ